MVQARHSRDRFALCAPTGLLPANMRQYDPRALMRNMRANKLPVSVVAPENAGRELIQPPNPAPLARQV